MLEEEKSMNSAKFVEIDTLTAFPASVLVRDQFGRPKTQSYGGVTRGRISSAACKRAVRISEEFSTALEGHLGVRTRRAGVSIIRALEEEFGRDQAAAAVQRISKVFGKVDEDAEPGINRQLAFLANEEIEAATALAGRIAKGESVEDEEIESLIQNEVKSVDIACFGRMFAGMTDRRMTAAVSVMHPFTVGRAVVETDFYIAKDDLASAEEPGAGFMDNQEFTSGLFYSYWRVDLRQLLRNLGGDEGLARAGLQALVSAIPVVSPSGKSASFGSYSRASWMMVRSGAKSQGSLASAFLKPVDGADQLAEASRRALELAGALKAAYQDDTQWAVMDIAAGSGNLKELVRFSLSSGLARG
jgi:CRISPR system Cascade subunit CasC